MDVGVLRGFATGARRGLVGQMGARVGQVLADPRVELEFPGEVAALRAAVKAHGEDGVAQVAAYTWFNRLTAARFMDVNGFSGRFAVVSPEVGSASVLPQILTRAQAGEFADEVPGSVRSAVTDLLSGSRVSVDPDFEAYGLLLGAMFRAWHEPLPEVFPAAVDWIRLLTPPDMLAPGSVRARAVEVMDAQACVNVEVVGWLYQFYTAELKEQINESKIAIDASTLAPVTQLFTPHWIVRYLVENSLGRLWLRSRPSSQLRERMDYFVEPVAGQQDTGVTVSSVEEIRVLDPACGSGHMLTYAFDLLYAIYEEEGYSPPSIPELIVTRNLRGLEIDDRAAQLASFALAMKARARDPKFLERGIQPDIGWIQPIVFDEASVRRIVDTVTKSVGAQADAEALIRLLYAFVDADSFGSLIRVDADAVAALASALPALEDSATDLYASHDLTAIHTLVRQANALVDHQYHVVVANPPYLGSGNMGAQLSEFAKQMFPRTKADLYAMFIERNAELACPAGSVAMITMHSWMFLSSYKDFREHLPSWGHLTSMAHLGARAFDSISGEVVQATAFIIDTEPRPEQPGVFLRLVDGRTEAEKDLALRTAIGEKAGANVFIATMQDFLSIPTAPLVYWFPSKVRDLYRSGHMLKVCGSAAKGLVTGDNDTFVRRWWEVSHRDVGFDFPSRELTKTGGQKWFPYAKGGEFRRWYGNLDSVVNWKNDGEALQTTLTSDGSRVRATNFNLDRIFKSGVSWTVVSTAAKSFRVTPTGFLFDAAAGIFQVDSSMSALGFLNSSVAQYVLDGLNPTLNLHPGYLERLPATGDTLTSPCDVDLVSIFRSDWDGFETSWDFVVNPLVGLGGGLLESLAELRWDAAMAATVRAQELEERNNRYFAQLYGLEDEVECAVPLARVSLTQNPYFRYAPNKGASRTEAEYRALFFADAARELISFGVGCIMGRYSLDKPGLVLADAGSTLADFDRLVPDARLRPDADGILAITAEQYFDDDIVTRLREFLAVAFGAESLEANVVWLETALGAGKRKALRDYFLNDFYNDHIRTYSKRPIYWQVSSPKGGFNALVYLHRYTPATLGVVHQNFAEEMLGKVQARVETIEHALLSAGKREAVGLGKERDALAAQRREVRDWIDSALFPLASTEIPLDLDDGVKQNYPKLAGVLKKVTGL